MPVCVCARALMKGIHRYIVVVSGGRFMLPWLIHHPSVSPQTSDDLTHTHSHTLAQTHTPIVVPAAVRVCVCVCSCTLVAVIKTC